MLRFLLTSILLPTGAFAADWQVDTVFGTVDSGNLAFESYTAMILSFLYILAGGVTVLRVIMGAVSYIQANGDIDQARRAKQTIYHALTGLALVFMAYLLTVSLVDLESFRF